MHPLVTAYFEICLAIVIVMLVAVSWPRAPRLTCESCWKRNAWLRRMHVGTRGERVMHFCVWHAIAHDWRHVKREVESWRAERRMRRAHRARLTPASRKPRVGA